MNKRKREDGDQGASKKLKENEKDPLLKLGDENIWIHDIFSYLTMHDYLSVMCTCATWSRLLMKNDMYSYLKLFLDYQRHMHLPSIDFFHSTTADDLYFDVIRFEAETFDAAEFAFIEDDRIVREIMKLVDFKITRLPSTHPSKSLVCEWNDLRTISNRLSRSKIDPDEQVLDLIEKYPLYSRVALLNDGCSIGKAVSAAYDHKILARSKELFQVFAMSSYLTDPDTTLDEHDFPAKYKSDRDLILHIIRYGPDYRIFENLGNLYKDDREIIFEAIRSFRSCGVMRFASEKLRSDKKLAITALRYDADSLVYLSPELWDDLDVIRVAFSRELCDDLDVIRVAFSQEYYFRSDLFSFVSERLKNNTEVALLAVKLDKSNYLMLGNDARCNRDVVLLSDISDIPPNLTNDREVCLHILHTTKGEAIDQCSDELKNDISFAESVLQKYPSLLPAFGPNVVNNRELVEKIVSKCGAVLSGLDIKWQNDKELVLRAIHSYARVFGHLPIEIRSDEEIARFAISRLGFNYYYCTAELKNKRELVLKTVKRDGAMLAYVPDKFKDDPEIVLLACKQKHYLLKYASDRLRNNEEFVNLV